jgi:YVTN family beta-propeller protein
MSSGRRVLLFPVVLAMTPPVAAADLLIVLNKSDHQAVLVDPATLEIVTTLATGTGPHEAAVSPDGRTAYVANYGAYRLFREGEKPVLERGHTISVVDLVTRTVVDTLDLGDFTMPHGMWVSRDGKRLWVTSEATQTVLELDLASGKITSQWKTGQEVSHMLVPAPDEKKLYVANIGSGTCTVIERASGKVTTVVTGKGAEGIDVAPDGREVWVTNRAANTISIIDAKTDQVIQTLEADGDVPIRAKFTPDGREVWVSCMRSNAIHVFDAKTRKIIARVAVAENPIGIQMSPDGARAFIASTNANRITVVDVKQRKVTGGFSPGEEPDGMAWARTPKAR